MGPFVEVFTIGSGSSHLVGEGGFVLVAILLAGAVLANVSASEAVGPAILGPAFPTLIDGLVGRLGLD